MAFLAMTNAEDFTKIIPGATSSQASASCYQEFYRTMNSESMACLRSNLLLIETSDYDFTAKNAILKG